MNKPFDKQDAIKIWMSEHHPELVVRFDETRGSRLGYCVIANTKAIVDSAGTSKHLPGLQMVEVDFNVHGSKDPRQIDWFFCHSPRKQIEVAITSPDYFTKLEGMLKLAKLI